MTCSPEKGTREMDMRDEYGMQALVAELLRVEPSEVLGYVLVASIRGTDDSSDMVVTQTSQPREPSTILLISGMQVMWDGMPNPFNDDENPDG